MVFDASMSIFGVLNKDELHRFHHGLEYLVTNELSYMEGLEGLGGVPSFRKCVTGGGLGEFKSQVSLPHFSLPAT